jgi:phosphoribosylformylglycinamidine (FGAM) synthase-like enzyme
VTLPGDAFTYLFSESAARALVALVPGREADFAALCDQAGVPAAAIGTAGGDALAVSGCFSVTLGELRAAHQGTLPDLFS